MAEQKKLIKYDSLAPNYDIAPVAIESLGAIGPLSNKGSPEGLGTEDQGEYWGGMQGLVNTSCSVWQLQFSEEMLFPSWARWETLDKTFLGSISCLCLYFFLLLLFVVAVCFSYSFILLISLLFSLLLLLL